MIAKRLGKLLLTILLLLLVAGCGVLEVDVEPSLEPGTGGEPTLPPATTIAEATATEVAPQTATATNEPTAEPTAPVEATEPVEPTATVEPTVTTAPPADTPAPQPEALRVAYVKDGDAFVWTPGGGEQPLTDSGGVENVDISSDGQLVAFTRDGHLWVVSSSGGDERQLTTDEDFAGIDFGDIASNIVGVRIYQTEWIPGTHILLFNTNPQLEGPGLLLTNDLWRVDVDSGELTTLLDAGQGGNFVLSPDGNQLALVRPDSISAANVDGSNVRELFTYAPVLTYSEYQYYAQPVWTPAGNSLVVAIPPADPMAQPPQATEIWRLAADGSASQQMGQVMAFMPQIQANVAIAPDASQAAFLEQSEAGGSARNLLLASLNEQVGEPALYAETVNEIRGWSPEGERLVFSRLSGNTLTLSLGAPPNPPQPIDSAEAPVIDLQWADDEQFVYTQQAPEGWDLVLSNTAGETQTIATIAGQPPAFDVDK